MPLSTDFLLQSALVAAVGVAFLMVGLRTLRADRHHYAMVRKRTGTARRAAIGTVGQDAPDADANVVHGMAISHRHGQRVVVRNGKVARDSIATC